MQLIDMLQPYRDQYAGLKMQPLQVRAVLASPVLTFDPLHFDAILATALVECLVGGLTFESEPDVIPLPLARLAEIEGLPLWACNDLIPGGETVKENHYLHKRALPSHLTKGSLQIGKGRHKEMRKPFPSVNTDFLETTCIGNAAALMELLTHVTAIGKKRRVGQGIVVEWQIDPISAYQEFGDSGEPLRPLPASLYPDRSDRMIGGWTPPYWYRPFHCEIVV